MRILVTGAKGKLGGALISLLKAQNNAVAGLDLDSVDITDREALRRKIASIQPELVIHCAALTAVDYCAEHPDQAINVNGLGTKYVALACQELDASLLYVSSNEVFDGETYKHYLEYDQPNPVNAYGYSKWMGEQAVRDLVKKHYIVRTSWLFAHGGKNFIHAILQRAREKHPIRVVTNEVSSPTYTSDLAEAIVQLIQTDCHGIYHLVNEGVASRYQFAREVLDQAGCTATPIEPIASAEFSRASRPPQYAILRNFAAAQLGITLRPWQDAVAAFLDKEGLRNR